MWNKKVNGYLTVEASFVMPIVLFLYLLVILLAFFLYNRCVISQDLYILALRGSRFTDHGSFYGEVIYGDMAEKGTDTDYLRETLADRLQYYRFMISRKVSSIQMEYMGMLKLVPVVMMVH